MSYSSTTAMRAAGLVAAIVVLVPLVRLSTEAAMVLRALVAGTAVLEASLPDEPAAVQLLAGYWDTSWASSNGSRARASTPRPAGEGDGEGDGDSDPVHESKKGDGQAGGRDAVDHGGGSVSW